MREKIQEKRKQTVAKKQTVIQKPEAGQKTDSCVLAKKCGGCEYQGVPYEKQLAKKEKEVKKWMGSYCKVLPIVGMKDPYHYRNKVHAVFDRLKNGTVISGIYKEGTHTVINVDACQIEDELSDAIIRDIRGMLKSFKIKTYDEDTGYGLLRHVLVRRGFTTGQVMVVLVLSSPILPSKNNFVKALRKLHPEISTVVLNINDKRTSMVLGERNITLYGKGYIEDELCGLIFRISPSSFYQINPVQTEVLYNTAIQYADLKHHDVIIDAYCGIGTIGLTAAGKVSKLIGIELNKDAVRDARINASDNHISNAEFVNADASEYISEMADEGMQADVIFMDPPRSGSTEVFMSSAVKLAPRTIVYISCGPESLKRDLEYLTKHGYKVQKLQPVDMFPQTVHVETVVLLTKK